MPKGTKYLGRPIETVYKEDPYYIITHLFMKIDASKHHYYKSARAELKRIIPLEDLHVLAFEKRSSYHTKIKQFRDILDNNLDIFDIEDLQQSLKANLALIKQDREEGKMSMEKSDRIIKSFIKKQIESLTMYFDIWTLIFNSDDFMTFQEAKDILFKKGRK